MKFGKLPDISQLTFELPSTNDRSLDILGRQPARTGLDAYIGCPRWSSKEWVGELYPKGTKPAEYLSHYSRSFNTIELNTTHYRIPTAEQVTKWKESASDNFVFCPKIPQIISHYRKLINCSEEIMQFVDAISHFEEKLGCSFVQMHESFGPNQFGNLKQFLQQWPTAFPLAIEFRHEDWFQEHVLLPAVSDVLEERNVAAVITDVAGRRDVLHMCLSNRMAMLRFVGNSLHPTDYTRWDAWMDRLAVWVDNGLETLYVFAHEPGDLLASQLGSHMIEKLNERFGLDLAIPGIKEEQGGQMSLF
ncbi:MAG: DUF72 domain-containing protein [Bacteroidota bacterium]